MSLSHETLSDIQTYATKPFNVATWPFRAIRAVTELMLEHDRLTGEVCELKRKAAAFDAIAKHQLIVHLGRCGEWHIFNRFYKKLTECHGTPLEAVEAAMRADTP